MTKWTEIIDADVAWACGKLGDQATPNEILDAIAREKGRAYATQEIQASIQRLKAKKQ